MDTSRQGHRKRLRERFLNNGLNGFLDYEIVELLLTLGTPRKDCKQQAKILIKEFGSLKQVLDTDSSHLQNVNGIGPSNVFGLLLYKSLFEKYNLEKLQAQVTLDSPQLIYDFLREKIGNKKKEHFTILFFDSRHKLIYDDVSIGTLNGSLVHPREVFNLAISHNASYIIVAHNHPSGDPTPSDEDINTTKRLIMAGKIIGITLADHLIVTNNNFISLKSLGNWE